MARARKHRLTPLRRHLRALERRDRLRVAKLARPVLKPAHRVTKAFRGLVGDLRRDIGRTMGGLFQFPGWVGRGVEQSVRHVAGAAVKPVAPAVRWMTSPLRRTISAQAKRQALDEVTMTADHDSHWEIIIMIGVGLLAAVGAVVMVGPSIGVDVASSLRPSWSIGDLLERVSRMDAAGLVWLSAGILLFGAAVLFWIRMVQDTFRRDFPTASDRTKWQLATVLLFIPGATAYFFKVYNRWTVRQFLSHHLLSVMVTSVALLVATSTYGTLWYFNRQAAAQVNPSELAKVPNLELDPAARQELLSREKYGAPLAPAVGGRTDPFAPLAGEAAAPGATPTPTPSPSPTATPAP